MIANETAAYRRRVADNLLARFPATERSSRSIPMTREDQRLSPRDHAYA